MALAMARQAAVMRYADAVVGAGVKIANVSRWCRDNGVDRRTFYRHRTRIEAEGSWQPRSRRPKTSPGATPAPVAAEIIRLRTALAPDNGADAIIAALGPVAERDRWAGRGWRVPHRSTVNKILKRAGVPLENRIQLVIGKCSVPQAACMYSLIRPLRMGFRRI